MKCYHISLTKTIKMQNVLHFNFYCTNFHVAYNKLVMAYDKYCAENVEHFAENITEQSRFNISLNVN